MTTTTQITCSIHNTDPDIALGLEIWLDHTQIFNSDHVQESVDFAHDFADHDAEHELRFVMKHKTQDHTKVDQQGNIVQDACIVIDHVAFDDIKLGQVFVDQAVYEHDFNGTRSMTKDKFYGMMGCNGVLSLQFASPIYLWLLEHM